MNTDTNGSTTLDRGTVRQVAKVLLAVVSLAFVPYLVTLAPGSDLLVPRTPVTVAALFGAAVTVVLVALLVLVAPKVATLARTTLDGPRAVVEGVASVAYWLVVLLAVLVAHSGLASVFGPLLGASPGCTTCSSCCFRCPRSRSSPPDCTRASTPPPT